VFSECKMYLYNTVCFVCSQSNTTVLKLDVCDNWLGPQGGNAVCEMLKENCFITELVCTLVTVYILHIEF